MKRFLFLVIAIVSVSTLNAQDAKYKALFMYHFTKQIEWPASDKEGDFVICVVNQQEILNQLRTVTGGKTAGSQSFSVVGVKTIDEVSKCHILYLPFADCKAEKLEAVLAKLGNSSTLVVADRPGSLKNGACVNFLLVDGKVKFEINEPAMNDRKLKVGSQLREVAEK